MENFYELNINENYEFSFNCKGKFKNKKDYKDNIYSKYSLEDELNISFYFSEKELKHFKEEIIKNLELGSKLNVISEEYMYYGFYENKIHPLGEYDLKESFKKDYYNENEGIYEDYNFYLDFDTMNSTIELIDKTIELNNLSNEDLLSYFDDINNLNILDK